MVSQRPGSAAASVWFDDSAALPEIRDEDSFAAVIRKLSHYIDEVVRTPSSFEDLQNSAHSRQLTNLVRYLAEEVHHRFIIHALMVLSGEYESLESDDNRGVNQTRGFACEYVAWRFVTNLSGREAVDYLLVELPSVKPRRSITQDEEQLLQGSQNMARSLDGGSVGERTPLVASSGTDYYGSSRPGDIFPSSNNQTLLDSSSDTEIMAAFENLNALEVAAVSEAKKFLSQRVVQKIIEAMWRGDIVFWETLSVSSVKEAKLYNKKKADPFCRLRVPRYLKFFEVIFFLSFLGLYYAVLVPIQRGTHRNGPGPPGVPPPPNSTTTYTSLLHPPTFQTSASPSHSFHHVTPAEILLYIWIASFAYDEFGEYLDAGRAFYAADFWSLWDIGIVFIGLVFLVIRVIGLIKQDEDIIGSAFDILALEALFLIPRVCSLLSLNPYFGTLIPCLREMTKDFVKFLSLVAILYLGFLTTFTLLARDNFTLREMSWIIVKVFFGSSYLGFDVAQAISPILGPPLMLIFITLTNILLITSLISLLSNSLTQILDHAREEYLFIYSVYVLEASTSNRLTYFLPPLNLLSLLMRPLRLVISADRLRQARIILLKITHSPFVAAIWIYENIHDYMSGRHILHGTGVSSLGGPSYSGSNKRVSYLKASSRLSRTVVAPSDGQVSLAGETRAGKQTSAKQAATPPVNGADPQTDLKALVLALQSQVEQLTAVVAAQKGMTIPGRDDADD